MFRFNPLNNNQISCVDVEQRNVFLCTAIPGYDYYQVHQEGCDLSNEASRDKIHTPI